MRTRHTTGTTGPPRGWDEAAERFLGWMVSAEKAGKTVRCYREELAAFADWYRRTLGEEPVLATISADDLVEYKAILVGRHMAPATINKKRAALKSFFGWCHRLGWMPAIEVPRSARQQVPATRWLSVAEERALRRAFTRAAAPRDVAMMEVFLNVGLRIEEAAAMEAQDLKLAERSGSVEVLGKGRKRRVVQLNSRVRRALKEWFRHRPGGRNPGPVWLGQRGGLTVSAIHRVVARYGELARLGDLSAHQLRHTCAKRLVESGARLEEVAAILGHENLNTTRRYVEPGREDLRKALERLAGEED